ncbi:MAG: transcription-repair coupling factor, partial [Eubacterium sp.]|nr:transcription-repair coupling factor [Eubacterium sp.]
LKEEKRTALIVTATGARARTLADDLSFFAGNEPVVMPEESRLLLGYEAAGRDELMSRIKGTEALLTKPGSVVIAPVSAALKRLMPHDRLKGSDVELEYGGEYDPVLVRERIAALGYERMNLVESPGEFSVRGGIVDVFPASAEEPVRIEFFGEEVDSIRTFDPDTQRSTGNLSSIRIGPAQQILVDGEIFKNAAARINKAYKAQADKLLKKDPEEYAESAENLTKRAGALCEYISNASNIQLLDNYLHYFYDESEVLWDYMENGILIVDDPDSIYGHLEARSKELREDTALMLEKGQIVPKDLEMLTGIKEFISSYQGRDVYVLTPFPKRIRGIDTYTEIKELRGIQAPVFNGRLEILADDLKAFVNRKYAVTVVVTSDSIKKDMESLVDTERLSDKVSVVIGTLTHGAELPDEKLVWITEGDIFGSRRRKIRRNRTAKRNGTPLYSVTDLEKGDYVVHENHGIGVFQGIEALDVEGERKDYLKIKYAGTDLLYVPVEQFDIVQKYIGSEGKAPKINRLSGSEWKHTKLKARNAIREMADELIELYAERSARGGYAFSMDSPWQREFEMDFPFVETEDQLRATEEIKHDMEKPEPMDRLLLGDVGFGKTEVAARALFKCISDGKKAAVLVPTTLLANQHYYTLKDRFEHFPIKVGMLSRFRSPAEQKKITQGVSDGSIDLIIGTHRLLSDDVRFKDLGLLVIDEEQRFGVAHKEKIKKLKATVDVLTLSATPIPRTLNMSLSGLRDMSVIEEPPEERLPVRTYVMEQDDEIIREAITREMERGGQAFVVFNRIQGIRQIADRIQRLVPNAEIAVGHGRMSENELEKIMMDFIAGTYDVLVATTIIENGIDIPNANTLIVIDADRYGLSQLYQLRGRVGRSNRLAYAYLMYNKDKVLTEDAEKRLRAIREFTEFGAGFKVAMRDLQIRGAGNMLGSEQSGHMMSIGY